MPGPQGLTGSDGPPGPQGLPGSDGPPGPGAAAIGPFASRPANTYGQQFYPTDGGYTQVADGTEWFNIIAGAALREPPSQATLPTRTNFGTSNLVDANGTLVFIPEVGTLQLRTAGKPIVTLEGATVRITNALTAAAGGICAGGGGVYMRESSTGKLLSLSVLSYATNSNTVSEEYWSSPTVRIGLFDRRLDAHGFPNGPPVVWQLRVSGLNVLEEVSYDGGLYFETYFSIPLTTAFTTQPDEFGICMHVQNPLTPAPICTFGHLAFAGD